MNEDDYTKLAEATVREAERRSIADPIESFYQGIKTMIQSLQDRLSCESDDGVDLEGL